MHNGAWRAHLPSGSASCRWQAPPTPPLALQMLPEGALWCLLTEWEATLVRALLELTWHPVTGDGLHLYKCEGSGG